MNLSIIVALGESGVIGKDGGMPWRLPNDLNHFKEITTGGIVIMGRKTFESIGRPLPNRENCVVSRTLKKGDLGVNVSIYGSLEEAIRCSFTRMRVTDAISTAETFIIGGGDIYTEALNSTIPVTKMYMTAVYGDIEGDTFFPIYDTDEWEVENNAVTQHQADKNNTHPHSFFTLIRVQENT